MAQRVRRVGRCGYCDGEFDVGGMTRHLSSCRRRRCAVAEADRRRGKNAALYHLRAQDAWRKDFWLDLEVIGSASLKTLGQYLRGIWLECCGHLSMFSESGWNSREFSLSARVSDVFGPGVQITHIYDYGDSSETLIRNVAVRSGKRTDPVHPIALMARNLEPVDLCITCGEQASWLCFECILEHDTLGTLCGPHSETHPHGDYGDPVLMVNSPRMGMCGYSGPADPPY